MAESRGSAASESSSLFAYAHPALVSVASLDLRANGVGSLSLPPPPRAPAFGASASHPRLPYLAPGTSLHCPPHAGLGRGGAVRAYQLFPEPSDERGGGGDGPPHFIASATHLKRLLTLPYSSEAFSLSVQRVGGTLLVDSDERVRGSLQALGPEAAQRLLHSSPCPNQAPPRDTLAPTAGGPAGALLEARLLYHSLSCEASLRALEGTPASPESAREGESSAGEAAARALWAASPPRPRAREEEEAGADGGRTLAAAFEAASRRRRRRPPAAAAAGAPHSDGDGDGDGDGDAPATPASEERRWAPPRRPAASFQPQPRLFSWTLGELRCVVESELILFRGAPGRPGAPPRPIALKLLSVDEQVTQRKCLSAWLDNIVAGVPELAVCYHKGGVVVGYETLATDGIPRLAAPPFDPQAVLAAGHSALSFLQAHCTAEGRTYWLRREASSATLRLFDVTQLIALAQREAEAKESASRTEAEAEVAEVAEAEAEAAEAEAAEAGAGGEAGMGLLCLRLAEQLGAGGGEGARERARLADRWRLLHKAEGLLGGPSCAQALAAALRAQAGLCLFGGAEALGLWQEGSPAQPPPLPPANPPLRAQLPPLCWPQAEAEAEAVAGGSAWLSDPGQLPDACLGAAAARLRAARRLQPPPPRGRRRRRPEAAEGEEARCARAEAALEAELARRAYAEEGGLGRALACAQRCLLAHRSAHALSLLADVHAALRAQPPPAAAAATAAWQAARCALAEPGPLPAEAVASLAAAEASAAEAGGAHAAAAAACYAAALKMQEARAGAAAAAAAPAPPPQPPLPPASAAAALRRAAAAWPGPAAEAAASAAALTRALRRRSAALGNERGAWELQAGRLEDAAAAFRAAAELFLTARDALNHALAARNAAHALRRLAAAGESVCCGGGARGCAAQALALCRAARRSLRRRDAAGGRAGAWDIVSAELGQCLMAVALLEAAEAGPGAAPPATLERLAEAAQLFSDLGPFSERDAAAAQFHLGELLARPLLAGEAVKAAALRTPLRHLQAALAVFARTGCALDHARTALRIAALQLAGGGEGAAAAVAALRAAAPAWRALLEAGGGAVELAAAEAALLAALREAARGEAAGGAARGAYEAALRLKRGGAPLTVLLGAGAEEAEEAPL